MKNAHLLLSAIASASLCLSAFGIDAKDGAQEAILDADKTRAQLNPEHVFYQEGRRLLAQQGYFSSTDLSQFFSPDLTKRLLQLFEGGLEPSKRHRNVTYNQWTIEVDSVPFQRCETFLRSSLGKIKEIPSALADYIKEALTYFSAGKYRVRASLIDDIGQTEAFMKEELMKRDDPTYAYIDIDPLFYHRDQGNAENEQHEILGFQVLKISHVVGGGHKLQLGTTPKTSLKPQGAAIASQAEEETEVEVLEEIDAVSKAGYFIDQTFEKDGRIIVHRHNGLRLFMFNYNNEDEPNAKSDPSLLRPCSLDCKSPKYEELARRKIILRITRIKDEQEICL